MTDECKPLFLTLSQKTYQGSSRSSTCSIRKVGKCRIDKYFRRNFGSDSSGRSGSTAGLTDIDNESSDSSSYTSGTSLPYLIWKGNYIGEKNPIKIREEARKQHPQKKIQKKKGVKFSSHSSKISFVNITHTSGSSPNSACSTDAQSKQRLSTDQLSREMTISGADIDSKSTPMSQSTPSEESSIQIMDKRHSKTIFITKPQGDELFTGGPHRRSVNASTTAALLNISQGSSELLMKSEKRKANKPATLSKKTTFLPPDFPKYKVLLRKLRKHIPELKDKPDVETVLKAYICETYFDLRLEGSTQKVVREMYENAIIKCRYLHNLITRRPEILPEEICQEILEIKDSLRTKMLGPNTRREVDVDVKESSFKNTLKYSVVDILDALEKDIKVYPLFYKELIRLRAEEIKVTSEMLDYEPQNLRNMLMEVSNRLVSTRHIPDSRVRFEMMAIIAASDCSRSLLKALSKSVDLWLDGLLKSLRSDYKTIREEVCVILCYMTTRRKLMKYLAENRYHNIFYDTTSLLLKGMEEDEDTFDEYYMILSHLMHYAPSSNIINAILERCSHFRNVQLISMWPRFIYYAFKFWPASVLSVSNCKVLVSLEAAYRRPISNKAARAALGVFCKRTELFSKFYTIIPRKEFMVRNEINFTKDPTFLNKE